MYTVTSGKMVTNFMSSWGIFKTSLSNFKVVFLYTVRPPPLKWNITKHGDEFNITWTPPEMLTPDSWSYTINYKICDKPQVRGTVLAC